MLITRPMQTGPAQGHGIRRDLLQRPLAFLLRQGLPHTTHFIICSAVVCPGTKLQSDFGKNLLWSQGAGLCDPHANRVCSPEMLVQPS